MRTQYLFPALACLCWPVYAAAPLGIFEDHADVGAVLHAGSVEYDAAKRAYTVAGSGENMWFASDAFQFAWKKVSGDVTLTADISFIGAGTEAHRKAVLMIRQNLDADSPYADIARHGDGLTSLQARDEKGAITREIQSAVKAPARVRIAKRGDNFYIWVAGEGQELQFAGGSMGIPLHDPYYVGIGVCSHNQHTVEKAVFSNVELTTGAAPASATPKLYSTLEVVPGSGDRRVVYVTEGRLSSPWWSSNDTIVFHSDSGTKKIPATGGKPEDVGHLGFAFDGAVATEKNLPADGLHNFSPQFAPDGQNVAFLSSGSDPKDMHEDKDVMLRLLSTKDGKVRIFARFTGGAESGPSWSPDSKRIAFITYQWIP